MTRTDFRHRLGTLREDVLALGSLAVEAVERAVGALQENDRVAAAALAEGDREIDARHAAVQQQAIATLATQQPAAGDLRAIIAALAIAGELERIGDYASGIAELVLRPVDEPALRAPDTFYQMSRAAVLMLRGSLDAYARGDTDLARRVWADDEAVDTFQRSLYQAMLLSMIENPTMLIQATHLLWITHKLERVADRATNICEQAIFMVAGHWPDGRRLDADERSARRAPPPANAG